MIVYGSSLSPFVRKVLAFAGEKGIELELQPTGFPNYSPEFLAASPFHKMPALRERDFTLADSSAIIHYLEAKFPEPALIPSEPELRGKAIWFEEFADTIACAAVEKIFLNRIVRPRFMGVEGNEEEASACERDFLPRMLDYLEQAVPDSGSFLVGGRLTVADIAVASPFVNYEHARAKIDRTRHPRTMAYVSRILERSSFAPIIERERAMLAPQAA